MIGLIIIAFIIALWIYYATTLDFEVGSGVSEEKLRAKEVEYTVSNPKVLKNIEKMNN